MSIYQRGFKLNNQDLNRFKELVYKEICTPEKLTIPDLLDSVKKEDYRLIENQLIALADHKKDEINELIKIMGYDSEKALALDNSFKIGIIVNGLLDLHKVGKNDKQ